MKNVDNKQHDFTIGNDEDIPYSSCRTPNFLCKFDLPEGTCSFTARCQFMGTGDAPSITTDVSVYEQNGNITLATVLELGWC